MGLGYDHIVRILHFGYGVQWVARFRVPRLDGVTNSSKAMISEYLTSELVRSNTDIPVPRIHALEIEGHIKVNVSFVLLDCLEGNVGMDLGMQVPDERKESFFKELARIHVRNSHVSFSTKA
jgi:aminoglycoside phosphotransferase (APT) family kinase protein